MIRALRALTVARAEGTSSERNYGLLGFVLCRGTRQGGQPISADRLSHRRAVNGSTRISSGRCLPYDSDCRVMPIQVQQVLGQGARDLVGLPNGSTQPVRQSDDVPGAPADLL